MLDRRTFMQLTGMAGIALWAGSNQAASSARRKQPNIVMLFADDQRADAVGYTGNKAIQTPNLDALAEKGLIFDNCFVNTSICCVSRANILSGQYPEQHGVDDFHTTFSRAQLARSIPAQLQKAGYQTAFFGKWGIGDSPQKTHQGASVFDYWAGQPKQTNYFHDKDCRYVRWNGYQRPLNDLCDCPADARGKKGYDVRIGTENLTDPVHVDSTVTPMHVNRFLDGRDASKPFCMLAFFKSPHGPYQDFDPATRSYTDGKTMPVSPAATLENAQHEPDVVKHSLGWKAGQQWLKDPKLRDMHMRNYYRAVSSMDLGIGRIMDALKARGLDDNTVILFTSDNGTFFTEHGSSGKWLMYEDSLRVPGFLVDPRRKGGIHTDRMVITTDFSATMLSLAGLNVPPSISGRDLTQLQDDPNAPWREDFYYTHPYGHGGAIARTVGIRGKRYAYTRYLDPDPDYEQLFDLRADPDQLRNLAEVSEFQTFLKQYRKRCNDVATSLQERQ